MKFSRLYSVILILLIVGACGERAPSSLKHQLGDVFGIPSPYSWYQMPDAELEKVVRQSGFGLEEREEDEADEEDPSSAIEIELEDAHSYPVRYLQYWMDVFYDEAVKGRLTLDAALPPRPRAFLVKNDEFANAAALSNAFCFNKPVTWATGAEGEAADFLLYSPQTGSLMPAMLGMKCLQNEKEIDIASFVKWLNALSARPNACHFEEKDGTIIALGSCKVAEDFISGLRQVPGKQIAINVPVPALLVTSGLIKSLKDPLALQAIVAHEMAHYLRSHTTTEGLYDAIYVQNSLGVGPIPSDIPELQSLVKKLQLAGQKETYYPIPNSRYSWAALRLLNMLGNTNSNKLCGEANVKCLTALNRARELYRNIWTPLTKKYKGLYPDPQTMPFPSEEVGKYFELENAVFEAFLMLKIKRNESDLGVDIALLKETVIFSTHDSALTNMNFDGISGVDAAMVLAQKAILGREAEIRGLVLEAREKRLGVYSYEQNADEIALELLSRTGLNPNTLALAIAEVGAVAIADPLFEIPWSECMRLRNQGWRDNNQEVYVPLGRLDVGSHHSHCYRLFNMDRELSTHNYQWQNGREHPSEFLAKLAM